LQESVGHAKPSAETGYEKRCEKEFVNTKTLGRSGYMIFPHYFIDHRIHLIVVLYKDEVVYKLTQKEQCQNGNDNGNKVKPYFPFEQIFRYKPKVIYVKNGNIHRSPGIETNEKEIIVYPAGCKQVNG
jgi:hypothetical protein